MVFAFAGDSTITSGFGTVSYSFLLLGSVLLCALADAIACSHGHHPREGDKSCLRATARRASWGEQDHHGGWVRVKL